MTRADEERPRLQVIGSAEISDWLIGLGDRQERNSQGETGSGGSPRVTRNSILVRISWPDVIQAVSEHQQQLFLD